MTKLNPDSVILQQLDEKWQKLFALLLWKYVGTEKVTLTAKEIEACNNAHPEGLIVYTHGHSDSIDFQLVTPEAAERLMEHDRTMRGRG